MPGPLSSWAAIHSKAQDLCLLSLASNKLSNNSKNWVNHKVTWNWIENHSPWSRYILRHNLPYFTLKMFIVTEPWKWPESQAATFFSFIVYLFASLFPIDISWLSAKYQTLGLLWEIAIEERLVLLFSCFFSSSLSFRLPLPFPLPPSLLL